MSSGFLDKLIWRRALKRFGKPTNNSLEININPILEAARLAPGSFGIQPFNIHVITNPNIKLQLAAVSYDQPQVKECTHLLVFSAFSNPKKVLDRYISSHSLELSSPSYIQTLNNMFLPMTSAQFLDFATKQTYIALGFSLTAAADLKIASCPMSGFIPEEVHNVLGLDNDELPVAYLAIGHYPDNDNEANPFPKLNLSLDKLVKYYK